MSDLLISACVFIPFAAGGFIGLILGLAIAGDRCEARHGGYQPKSDQPLDPLKLKPPRERIDPRIEVKPPGFRYPRKNP